MFQKPDADKKKKKKTNRRKVLVDTMGIEEEAFSMTPISRKRSRNFLNSDSSNRSGVQEQPKTFWTQCPFCRAKLQYHMEVLNRFLLCHICRKAFEAHELRDGVNLRNETRKSAASNFIDLSSETQNSDSSNRSGVQEQPKTFWIQCPFCRAKLQYHMEVLNRFLLCHICRKAFEAHELWDSVTPESLRNETLKSAGNFIDLSSETQNYYDSDEEVRVLRFKPSNTPFGKMSACSTSKPPSFSCEICFETKSVHESFGIKYCNHVYCTDCIVKYIESKLKENIASIGCPVPNCKGSLEPEHCHSILKPEVFEKWGMRLCEDVVVGSQKFYCPFKDCSAMLIDDGEEIVTESECPNCKRLFCAQCKVPWHDKVTCAKFKRLNKNDTEKDDIKMEKLAYKKHWRKCPWCGIYVEKSGGCSVIQCRCGTLFSFDCQRRGCKFCLKSKRTIGPSMGYFVFMEEYRRIHRDPDGSCTGSTTKLGSEKWRSMSRSEKKPYENPEMEPCRIVMKPNSG